MSFRVKDLSRGDEFHVILPADDDPVEYPKDFFTKKKQRPRLQVNTQFELAQVRGYVYGGLQDGQVAIQHVNSYLYQVLKGYTEVNQGKWSSFGVTIAEDGARIGPFCMLDVDEVKDGGVDGKASTEAIPQDDQWLPMYLLGLYRVGRATVPEYRALLMRNLIAQCQAASGRAKNLTRDTEIFFDNWGADPNFCKIVAGVDMFYHRFKKSQRASLRFGTIVSRYKDCAALSTFSHLVKMTGLKPGEVVCWILLPSVLTEFRALMAPGNEIDESMSYMPYLIDMGLSQKSPYSSVRNPCFHFWGQLTALLIRSSRAKNARVPNDIPLSELTTSAWLFAYAVGRTADLKALVIPHNATAPRDSEAEQDLDLPPTGKNPIEWVAWYNDIGKVPTAEMKHFGKAAVSALTDIRADSMAKYAKSFFESV
ncbi:nucleoprotein [Wufeng Myotis altarium vesiculovirus 1]|uniref:nucleoprotein n=1 Tax=Wufeng Myotis altarium vesiculovirus 1 TaxID=2929011 RepID=UPI002481E36D|nr:nucleoprotein [Wufeng Myotis altarium vesiculovirus 1]UOX72930.1 nucleoprotein [Wufeng Myotis altarium vesiculovirus 1]